MGNFLATWESFLALLNSSDDRDIALGQFMYEWGNLESKLFFLFYILIGASRRNSTNNFFNWFSKRHFIKPFYSIR